MYIIVQHKPVTMWLSDTPSVSKYMSNFCNVHYSLDLL